jgi:aromatic-L-amino-acid/L-tryptophan decarboxylase
MKKNNDMPPQDFRNYGHLFVDWIADYLENIEDHKVLPGIKPGDIKSSLPASAPSAGESMENIMADFEKIIMPGITHWNHPDFMGYFNSTSSGPGILAEFLTAALNQNGMIWKTSPASAELEEIVLNWFREMAGLPNEFWGIIYDTASTSSLHAFTAAREQIYLRMFAEKKFFSRKEILPLMFYTSEHANISIEKAALTIGIKPAGVKKIKADSKFRMDSGELKKAILEDKKQGCIPFCVSATIGTTSTISIDPIEDISEICSENDLWLHVDAAYAGNAAILPEKRELFKGWEKADSIVINPHKWMFTPMDLSAFYTRKPDVLKKAFTYIPEYLKTSFSDINNYMDYGFQLGRRFRSLKFWFIIKYFGVEGLKDRIREHIRIAKLLEEKLKSEKDIEIIAPVDFAAVCFRIIPGKNADEETINLFNEKFLNEMNSRRDFLISHSKINNMFFLRVVCSGLRTTEEHVLKVFEEIKKVKKEMNVLNG